MSNSSYPLLQMTKPHSTDSLAPSPYVPPAPHSDGSRDSSRPDVTKPILPVRFIDSAKRTAFFPRHPRAALPKKVLWGVHSLKSDRNLWNKGAYERQTNGGEGRIAYFTEIYADLSDPLALSWDKYVRTLPFMSRVVAFLGPVEDEQGEVFGRTTAKYAMHEWVRGLIGFTQSLP